MDPLQASHRCGPTLAVMGLHAVDHNIGDHGEDGQEPSDQVKRQLDMSIKRFGRCVLHANSRIAFAL